MGVLESLSARISSSIMARFGVALFATFVALLVAGALNPLVGVPVSYVAALVAAAFAAWFCGTGPSIVSIAVSLLGIDYWFISPTHSLRIARTEDRFTVLAFLSAGAVIVAIGEASRREKERLQRAAGELEEKVRERTGQLEHANQNLRELTARLLNLQDEERRRIARELHDNAGQALAALAMNLCAVAKDLERLIKTAGVVADSASLVQQMGDDIRTMSYLLHPPLLDETGLAPALRWYVQGFAERSKIAAELECGDDLGRLSQEVETAIFRLVQECLTNVHRHSDSPIAAIRITRSDGLVRVEVRDNGRGMSSEKLTEMESGGTFGVGIRGMRERVRQLGGSLEISSDGAGAGMRVVARLPATEAAPSGGTASVVGSG